MTEFLLIRHGETDWNADHRLQGHIDIPLNATGCAQARALAHALLGAALDAVFASDLKRAWDTAEPIAQICALERASCPELRERCYGAFEGLRKVEIGERFPADHAHWIAREPDARPPAGERIAETLNEFRARVAAVFEKLANERPGLRIALVSHGGVLDCAFRIATDYPLDAHRNFAIGNASINRFGWIDGRLKLIEWGDVRHLQASSLDELDGMQLPIE